MSDPITTTTVINIKKQYLNQMGYQNLEEWLLNPNHVYIGRNMSFYVRGANASKWKNPFSVKRYGIDKCLELYRQHIINTPELLSSLNELQGKVLGCWCITPDNDKCHGVVLVQLIEEYL